MTEHLVRVVEVADWAILVYFFLAHSAQTSLLISAAAELRKTGLEAAGLRRRLRATPLLPKVTVLVAAYNEEAVIAQTVTAAMALDYPSLEVVVVNDGSTDGTLAALRERYDLQPVHRLPLATVSTEPIRGVYASRMYPNLLLVDKENGGKADSLNAAASYAAGRLICAIDADTVIEPDALEMLVCAFTEDRRTIAAGGTLRIANGCELHHARVVRRRAPRNWLAAIQAVEYPRAFMFGRLGWNRLGDNVIISGAFGLFDRRLVLAAGGYAQDTVGEDMELVLRMRRHAYEAGRAHRVVFLSSPVAWTETPETLRTLARQRNRWHRGLADVLIRHRKAIGRPRYGKMGMLVLPYYLFFELVAPLIEAIALVVLLLGLPTGVVSIQFALLFVLVAYGYGLILSLAALTMEERVGVSRLDARSRLRQLGWLFMEQFGYRQATVVWRLWGLVAALRGDLSWGLQTRRGFANAPGDAEGHP